MDNVQFGCRGGVSPPVWRITVRFVVFFGGSKPPPYRLGEKSLIRCVPVGFVGVARQGQSLRLPSAATVSLRLGHTRALTTHCVVIHYPRAASLPLHKGGMSSGHPFIRCVTVWFVGIVCLQIIAHSLRYPRGLVGAVCLCCSLQLRCKSAMLDKRAGVCYNIKRFTHTHACAYA